jgi:3-hydroxyisobutyrate dehydrogenase-like beta-hydroxyacid dehydrogenase
MRRWRRSWVGLTDTLPLRGKANRNHMDIGFIGLGRMGLAMARNLAKPGHSVRAWNRSPVEPGAIPDGEIVATPAEAFGADVVFTMLSDDAAIREVLLDTGVLDHARPGAVHVVTATISVEFAGELTAAHERAGIGYVSAPVFGRPDVAEAAQLNIVAAGARQAIATVQPLFDVLGRRMFLMGEDPKQANAAKIAGNMVIAMAIEALAEAVVLTEAQGVERQAFIDLMLQTLFGCRAYQNYGGKIVENDYETGFRLALGLKDLRLATAAGASSGKAMPMLDAVREQMTRAADAGLSERDWSALAAYTLTA